MEEKSVIVIYEKEIKLNQILKEQLSIKDIYQIYEATDEKDLIELIERLTINILILNLNNISEDFKNILKEAEVKNPKPGQHFVYQIKLKKSAVTISRCFYPPYF